MMQEITYTLLSDGSSDKALMPILNWLLRFYLKEYAIQNQWADLRQRTSSALKNLSERIQRSIEWYPCDLLFIHRDAEKESLDSRVAEIRAAVNEIAPAMNIPTICVVPVRMTEAWLLLDEQALRRAASNPNGQEKLKLPPIRDVETDPDPKQTLYEALRQASGLIGRRRSRFSPGSCVHRVAELIEDFSALRGLSAFDALEQEVQNFAKQKG